MSRRTEKCPTCKGKGQIIVDDWLIKGMTEEELAKEKEEALADIVEVVRCKDCLYFNKTHPCSGICREHGVSFNHNDYCRYGIRNEK